MRAVAPWLASLLSVAATALLATNIPAAATPGTIRVQAFVTDPVWPKGDSVSNGLELEIAP